MPNGFHHGVVEEHGATELVQPVITEPDPEPRVPVDSPAPPPFIDVEPRHRIHTEVVEMAMAPPLFDNTSGRTYPSSVDIKADYAPFRLRGLVRDIRADAQNLELALKELVATGDTEDKEARGRAIATHLAETKAIFESTRESIASRFQSIRELLDAEPEVYDLVGDGVSNMENTWSRLRLGWPRESGADPDGAVRAAKKLEDLTHALIFDAGLLTIPARVNSHLQQLRIGQTLDFHKTFQDELPDRDERIRILRDLQAHPALIDGVVDADSGTIVHASSNSGRRALSYIVPTAAVIAGGVATYYAPVIVHAMDPEAVITADRARELIVGYVAMFAGAAAHIVISALKQARANDPGAFTALEEWATWVHVKEMAILGGVLTVWIGFIGLALTLPKLDWFTSFAAGYGIDSIADLYLQRFETSVSSAVKAITDKPPA
jgi:hypothetical protein